MLIPNWIIKAYIYKRRCLQSCFGYTHIKMQKFVTRVRLEHHAGEEKQTIKQKPCQLRSRSEMYAIILIIWVYTLPGAESILKSSQINYGQHMYY